jgi:hypothetical protein
VLHWNGVKWSKVKSPNPGRRHDSVLTAVTAVATDDVWAVGSYTSGTRMVTLSEHWDGTRWLTTPSVNPSHNFNNSLADVSAVASNDVWAVGTYSTTLATTASFVEHWNGRRWSRPTNPNPGVLANDLLGVSAVSATDVWAVGQSTTIPGVSTCLIEHWNGVQWSQATCPSMTGASILRSVSMASATEGWVVGQILVGTLPQTVALHWDGDGWSRVTTPGPGPFGNVFAAVLSVAGDNAWAVGTTFTSPTDGGTLIAHWNGAEWATV